MTAPTVARVRDYLPPGNSVSDEDIANFIAGWPQLSARGVARMVIAWMSLPGEAQ